MLARELRAATVTLPSLAGMAASKAKLDCSCSTMLCFAYKHCRHVSSNIQKQRCQQGLHTLQQMLQVESLTLLQLMLEYIPASGILRKMTAQQSNQSS